MADTAISAPAVHPEPAHAAPFERPDFEIVPRKGLILVAVAVVLLIIAIAANKLWPLVFLHVTGGASWTIIDLFLGLILGPIIGTMSIPARIEFTTRLMPKMVLIMPTVVTITLAAGWQLGNKLGTVLSRSAPRVGGGELHRRRRDGGDRARPARAGQYRGAVRAQEAAAQPRGDRAPDEALHVQRRRARR